MGWFGSKYSCKSVKHPLLLHKNVTQSQPCRTFSCRNHNLPTTCGAKKRRQRGRVKNRKSGIYGSAGVARLQSIWGLASLSAESMWTLATVWTTRNRYFCELPSTNWNTAHGCHQQVYVTFRTFLLWQRPNNGQTSPLKSSKILTEDGCCQIWWNMSHMHATVHMQHTSHT